MTGEKFQSEKDKADLLNDTSPNSTGHTKSYSLLVGSPLMMKDC